MRGYLFEVCVASRGKFAFMMKLWVWERPNVVLQMNIWRKDGRHWRVGRKEREEKERPPCDGRLLRTVLMSGIYICLLIFYFKKTRSIVAKRIGYFILFRLYVGMYSMSFFISSSPSSYAVNLVNTAFELILPFIVKALRILLCFWNLLSFRLLTNLCRSDICCSNFSRSNLVLSFARSGELLSFSPPINFSWVSLCSRINFSWANFSFLLYSTKLFKTLGFCLAPNAFRSPSGVPFQRVSKPNVWNWIQITCLGIQNLSVDQGGLASV